MGFSEEYKQAVKDLKYDEEYNYISLSGDIVSTIYHRMHELDIGVAEIAKRIKKPTKFVKSVLKESHRLNLKELNQIMFAIGLRTVFNYDEVKK